MTAVAAAPCTIGAARALAERLLDTLPERLEHSAGVAHRAAELTRAVAPADRVLLVAAAWLHDIGYAPETHRTGFHPVDGALYLAARGWTPRVCALVAHHSGAAFTAPAGALVAFPDERSPVSDALAYADQTVGPWGRGPRSPTGWRRCSDGTGPTRRRPVPTGGAARTCSPPPPAWRPG
jgi:putative nucleotidyltransferase with HDIG domain